MIPYYQDDAVTIYHGDCADILPVLVGDAVVTDPPYGVGFKRQEWDERIPDWLGLARAVAPVVVFTTSPTTLWFYPQPTWVLCWYRPASNARSLVGGFGAWSPIPVYGKAKFKTDTINLHAIQHASPPWIEHPSPKPLSLMRWLVAGTTEPGATVLDPFMGSGTTLRAAKDLGRKAIGIEIEERYCEIAAKRCAQEVLDLAPAQPSPSIPPSAGTSGEATDKPPGATSLGQGSPEIGGSIPVQPSPSIPEEPSKEVKEDG